MFRLNRIAVSLFALSVSLLALVPSPGSAAGVSGAAALTRLPSPLGSSSDQTQTLPLKMEGGNKVAVLPSDWQVGDCVLLQGARVEFRPDGTVHFTGSAYTKADGTHIPGVGTIPPSGDVFHLHFIGKGDRGVRVVIKPQFRLPEKGDLPVGADKAASVDETQSYDASTFDALTSVDWLGAC